MRRRNEFILKNLHVPEESSTADDSQQHTLPNQLIKLPAKQLHNCINCLKQCLNIQLLILNSVEREREGGGDSNFYENKHDEQNLGDFLVN